MGLLDLLGLLEPKGWQMTRLVSAPGSFLRGRRAWRRFLRTIIRNAEPDIMVGTEAKYRTIRALVPQTRWVVRQRRNSPFESRRGGFAIWRRRKLTPEPGIEPRQVQTLGSRLSLFPSPVLNRYIGHADLIVGGRKRRVFWVHFPLKATRRQDEYMRNLKRAVDHASRQGLEWLVGGDFNMPPAEVAASLGGRAHGVRNGITGWVTGPGVRVHREHTMPAIKGFDHRPHWIDVQN